MMSRLGWSVLDQLSSATRYQLAWHVQAEGVTLLTAALVSNVASEISSLIDTLAHSAPVNRGHRSWTLRPTLDRQTMWVVQFTRQLMPLCWLDCSSETAALSAYFTSVSLFRRAIFTALHGMQSRYSDGNSVCPSVKRVHCDKTEESCV